MRNSLLMMIGLSERPPLRPFTPTLITRAKPYKHGNRQTDRQTNNKKRLDVISRTLTFIFGSMGFGCVLKPPTRTTRRARFLHRSACARPPMNALPLARVGQQRQRAFQARRLQDERKLTNRSVIYGIKIERNRKM